MKPKLSPHLIPQHWSQLDEDMLRDWRPESVKVVWTGMPAHLDSILRLNPQFIIVRDYELADAGQRGVNTVADAIVRGREHAETHRKLAEHIESDFNYPRQKILFEGWNEPPIWKASADDTPWYKIVDAYEAMRLTAVSAWGGRAIAGNINTGHPDNSGPDTDPNWFWFPLLKGVLEQSRGRHGLGLHEYCWFGGPVEKRPDGRGGWSWDMGRYTRNRWQCDIYLTEIGVDNAVYDGAHAGWQKLPLADMETRALTYANWLLWYARELSKDARVKGAYIFTHDSQSQDWVSFDTRNESFWRAFVPMYRAADFSEPAPPSPYPDWLTDVIDTLPRHPTMRYPKRFKPVDSIVIHHTATDSGTTVEDIARYHVNADLSRDKSEWAGIGYSVVIDEQGKTYLTQPLDIMANHIYAHNDHTIGLSFIGNFTKHAPTEAQYEAGRRALAWLLKELNLKPEAVRGHKDFSLQTTACPGNLPTEQWWRALLPTFDRTEFRNLAWNAAGFALNVDSAFYKEAKRLNLGFPMTPEFDRDGYRAQGYQKGILVCRIGDWNNMTLVEWL